MEWKISVKGHSCIVYCAAKQAHYTTKPSQMEANFTHFFASTQVRQHSHLVRTTSRRWQITKGDRLGSRRQASPEAGDLPPSPALFPALMSPPSAPRLAFPTLGKPNTFLFSNPCHSLSLNPRHCWTCATPTSNAGPLQTATSSAGLHDPQRLLLTA